MNNILVTGGAGFIGRNLVEMLTLQGAQVSVIDYAQSEWSAKNFRELRKNRRVRLLERVDIRSREQVSVVLRTCEPEMVIHLAAESHVDKSIAAPYKFIESNILGTHSLLEAVFEHWEETKRPAGFRFLYCSTDEVYGSIDEDSFQESMPVCPLNPYSATKASGEHLVTAWLNTYGLPGVITRCSNNYGQYQGADKLVPLTIGRCLRLEPVLLHGDGKNVRDWIHVADHCRGILDVLRYGTDGEAYNIGGGQDYECTNEQIVQMICDLCSELTDQTDRHKLITHVMDRAGNDRRYSMNTDKLRSLSSWHPKVALNAGLRETVQWYIDNQHYCRKVEP